MLKIKRAGRITNDEVFQRVKEKRLLLKIKKKKIDATHGQGIYNSCSKYMKFLRILYGYCL